VKGSGKHVVRAGYGLYFGQTFINIPLFMLQQTNALLFTTVQLTNSVLPGTTGGASDIVPSTGKPLSQFRYGVDPNPAKPIASTQLPAGTTGQLIDQNYRNPYTQQWNGGYTWAITSNSAIEVEYVHVLGLHDSKRIVINPKVNGVRGTDAPLAAAGLPLLGAVRDNQPIGRSRYDAMNLSYRKRLSRHFSVNTSYVLSRALGYNGASASFGNAPTDLRDIFAAHDFGPTPADEKHRFVFSGIVNLPFGINFAPILQLASGRPYQALEGNNDVYGFGGSQGNTHAIVLNDQPTNMLATAAFSTAQLQACLAANTCHQVAYDNLRGENFFQLDTRFSKTLKFGERMKLDLIFQAFDLTNRANFGATYQGNIRSAAFMQPNGFITPAGVIVPKSFSGEFGARFSF